MTIREKYVLLFGGITVLAIASANFMLNRSAQAERRPRKVRQFNPDDFRPQQVVDAYPAIENPPHVAVDGVNGQLQPNELVLGVELNGLSRAYPINMLTGPSREIFNDTLGDRMIAVTW